MHRAVDHRRGALPGRGSGDRAPGRSGPDQVAAGGDQLVVLAAERMIAARAGRRPSRTRSAARRSWPAEGLGAAHRRVRRPSRPGRWAPGRSARARAQHDGRRGRMPRPARADGLVVDDRRRRHAGRPAPAWLDLGQPGVEPHGLDPVCRGPPGQHVELGQLLGLGGHHDLAAPAPRHVVAIAPRHELVATLAAQLGLLRTGA